MAHRGPSAEQIVEAWRELDLLDDMRVMAPEVHAQFRKAALFECVGILGLVILFVGFPIAAYNDSEILKNVTVALGTLLFLAGASARTRSSVLDEYRDEVILRENTKRAETTNIKNLVVATGDHNMNIAGDTLGDTYSNNPGATIINRSMVLNSLNTLKARDVDLALAFERLKEPVSASSSVGAATIYESLVSEATQSTPDKGKMRGLWDDLIALAPGVKAIAGSASKVVEFINSLDP